MNNFQESKIFSPPPPLPPLKKHCNILVLTVLTCLKIAGFNGTAGILTYNAMHMQP